MMSQGQYSYSCWAKVCKIISVETMYVKLYLYSQGKWNHICRAEVSRDNGMDSGIKEVLRSQGMYTYKSGTVVSEVIAVEPRYRPFHWTFTRSSAIVNWHLVMFYETGWM